MEEVYSRWREWPLQNPSGSAAGMFNVQQDQCFRSKVRRRVKHQMTSKRSGIVGKLHVITLGILFFILTGRETHWGLEQRGAMMGLTLLSGSSATWHRIRLDGGVRRRKPAERILLLRDDDGLDLGGASRLWICFVGITREVLLDRMRTVREGSSQGWLQDCGRKK